MSDWDLDAAHRHSSRNRAELERSTLCCCFYCGASFAPADIIDWIDTRNPREAWTARCPHCGIDSVIGDASGLPMETPFLDAMYARWFEETVPNTEVLGRYRNGKKPEEKT